MTPRNRFEAEIIDRLSRLSAEDMQRVAEDYARIRYPQRFPRFDFRALSPEGKSRKGWPDAWVCLNDRKDGVEATGDKSKPSVEKHLWEDLDKAIAHDPPLSGLIIVSGCPTVHLKDYEIADWRRRFITDACIPADRLELVFGPGLVADLAHPEFSRTRVEVLGIDDAPTYFKPVRARMGPDEGRLSDFIPSAEDYEKRRVYRPAAADEILAHLHQEGRALIRGIGASGKTVLAWLLGLEAAEQRHPAYYLDLAWDPDSSAELGNALIADLNRFAHRDTLFILDNCHLDEPLAKEIALGWEDIYHNQRPRLLLVGRELRTSRGSAIDGLAIPSIPLHARQPEVCGVYRRLAERHLQGAEPPQPPSQVLDDWVQTFGGNPGSPDTTTDLIAFSAAVLRRMPRLLSSDWTLTARDAADQVRETYLEKLSEGERQNLIRLCACQQIELALDPETLADRDSGFRACNRKFGLVFSDQAGAFSEYRRYRLAHAALGDLILTAANAHADVVPARLAAASQYPHFGNAMLGRLLTLGVDEEARQIAAAMVDDFSVLAGIGALQYVYLFCVRMDRLGIGLAANVQGLLSDAASRKQLTDRALQTPLHFLTYFLGYAAKNEALKPIFTALAMDLATPTSRKQLTDRALQTPLDHLANFLGYAAKTGELKPIFTALAMDLATPTSRKQLTDRALQTPLDHLANFLGYADRTVELASVFDALAEDLGAPASRERLTKRALQTPLDHLAYFLGYAAKNEALKPVFDALADDLDAPASRKRLIERALLSQLNDLVNFLGYVARSEALKPVFEALAEDLATPASRERLTERALQTPLDQLANFLRYANRTVALAPVFEALAEDLATASSRDRLSDRVLLSPLDHLFNFLGYAARTMTLKPVFVALAEDLTAPASLEQLFKRVLQTPLGLIANFLGFAAKTVELKRVFEALAEDLAAPPSREHLTEEALQTPLDELANFLSYTVEIDVLRPTCDVLADELCSLENLNKLTEKALQAPLFSLTQFLDCAASLEILEGVSHALAKELAVPSNLKPLIEQALQAPLCDLVDFFQCAEDWEEFRPICDALTEELGTPEYARVLAFALAQEQLGDVVEIICASAADELWRHVIAAVELEAWQRRRQTEPQPSVHTVVAFQEMAEALGISHLAITPASRLVLYSKPADWHQPGTALDHLSQVVRFAKNATAEEIYRLLLRVATPEWLDESYQNVPPGVLANALLSLTIVVGPARSSCLRREMLTTRVREELKMGATRTAPYKAEVLALLGTTSVLGISFDRFAADWPTSKQLAEILLLKLSPEEQLLMEHIRIELWLGLREMARWREEVIKAPKKPIQEALDSWMTIEQEVIRRSLPPYVRKLSAGMVAWLQQCKSAGLRLVPPDRPLQISG